MSKTVNRKVKPRHRYSVKPSVCLSSSEFPTLINALSKGDSLSSLGRHQHIERLGSMLFSCIKVARKHDQSSYKLYENIGSCIFWLYAISSIKSMQTILHHYLLAVINYNRSRRRGPNQDFPGKICFPPLLNWNSRIHH
jgi:hypothetical protein